MHILTKLKCGYHSNTQSKVLIRIIPDGNVSTTGKSLKLMRLSSDTIITFTKQYAKTFPGTQCVLVAKNFKNFYQPQRSFRQ